MSDYYVTCSETGNEVTVWEVEDNRVGVGPGALALLTLPPDRARVLANAILRTAAEILADA